MALTQITEKGIKDGEILNADVNASAAIAGSKINPDFGSQGITTTGVASIGNGLTLTGTNPYIDIVDSNNNDDFTIKNDNGTFKIQDKTDTADRFNIDSSGNVGINTSSPSTGLQVHKDWVSNYGSVSVEGSTNALVGYGFRSNGTYKGGLIYRDGTSGSYLDLGTYNGDHPILFRPNATEEVRIDADGLKFNGDTAATNALDDYEEGTHETTVTISGNTSFSYSSRNLAYTKIGRVVHLLGRINMTGAGGGSSFEFTLPFPCADGSPDYQYETSNEFQVIRGDDSRTFRIREGESAAKCQSDGSAAGIGDSSPHINVNLTYFTNS